MARPRRLTASVVVQLGSSARRPVELGHRRGSRRRRRSRRAERCCGDQGRAVRDGGGGHGDRRRPAPVRPRPDGRDPSRRTAIRVGSRQAATGRGDVSHAALEFNHPYGGSGAIHRFALNAMRHMHDYGTTHEQIAEVAATIRNNGHATPRRSISVAGPLPSRTSSPRDGSPSRCTCSSAASSGQCGVAVVLTSGERARDLRRPPVYVLGGAMEMDDGPHHNPALNRVERQPRR